MKKPNNNLLRLHEAGRIRGIFIEQKQTGSESADTFCVITCGNKTIKGLWSTYSHYIKFKPFHDGIACIYDEYINQLQKWFLYENDNERELKEYERLKAKFESNK